MQLLRVGQHGVRLRAEEVRVPDVEQAHDDRHVLGQRRRAHVLVDGVEAGEQLAERVGSERDDQRQADRRVDGVAAADPVPEPERVRGVDAERRDLVERGRDGDEVVGDGIGLAALSLVRSADRAGPLSSPAQSQSRARRALVRVSSVVKVLDATMKSVVSGSRSAVFRAMSAGSMFETKRAWMPASA